MPAPSDYVAAVKPLAVSINTWPDTHARPNGAVSIPMNEGGSSSADIYSHTETSAWRLRHAVLADENIRARQGVALS